MSEDLWLDYIKTVKKIKNHRMHFKKSPHFEMYDLGISKTFFSSVIDLHGLTQEQAFEELKLFLANAYNTYQKEVLIITGKGTQDSPSIFKLVVPRWLKYTELNAYVRDYFIAKPRFGGEGAITVLIKKKRDYIE